MRKFWLLALTLALGTTPLAYAQTGAAGADTGFSYRHLQQLPDRSPALRGTGTVRLPDGSELRGSLRLYPDQTVRIRLEKAQVRKLTPGALTEFTIDGHRYVPGQTVPGVGAAGTYVEVLKGEGTLRWYAPHSRPRQYVVLPPATAAAPFTAVTLPANLPLRGYNDAFEAGLRTLFAERADLLNLVAQHYITAYNLRAALEACESGQAMRF